jgi:hypothetical protein
MPDEPIADSADTPPVTLSPQDAAALEAVLEGTPASDPAREARVKAWLHTLKQAPVPASSPDLAARALAAIQIDRMRISSRAAQAAPAARTISPRRWRYLKEAAAMATAAAILVAVLIPGIAQARQSARRVACANNLSLMSNAFATYAAANTGELPALAMPANRNWLGLGKAVDDHSNAANLLPLVAGAYITADHFACPGRGTPAVAMPANPTDVPDGFRGYSYVNLYGPARPSWNGSASTLVLADRNPLFDPDSPNASPSRNSTNHGSHGSYVLSADGAVAWQITPNVGPKGDNIWTLGNPQSPRILYSGTEVAESSDDVFLAP